MRQGVYSSSFATMKKLVFFAACLLTLGLHPITSYAADPDIVVVRIHEGDTNVRAVISHGEGKEKRLVASADGYHKLLFKLYQEGYTLKSTFSASGVNVTSTTLLFIKGQ
jgi:hypothetical protein